MFTGGKAYILALRYTSLSTQTIFILRKGDWFDSIQKSSPQDLGAKANTASRNLLLDKIPVAVRTY